MSNKSWRFKIEDYEKKKIELIRSIPHADKWYEFSSEPKRYEDLIISSFASMEDHEAYICLYYACSGTQMTEEFVKDLIYVNSGLALKGCWDEDVINFVLDMYSKMPKTSNKYDIGTFIKDNFINDVPDLLPEYVSYICDLYYKGLKHRRDMINKYLAAYIGDFEKYCERITDINDVIKDSEIDKLLKRLKSRYDKLDQELDKIVGLTNNDEIVAHSNDISEKLNSLFDVSVSIDDYISNLNSSSREFKVLILKYKRSYITFKRRFSAMLGTISVANYVPFYVMDRLDWYNLGTFQKDLSFEFVNKYGHFQNASDMNKIYNLDEVEDSYDEEF